MNCEFWHLYFGFLFQPPGLLLCEIKTVIVAAFDTLKKLSVHFKQIVIMYLQGQGL